MHWVPGSNSKERAHWEQHAREYDRSLRLRAAPAALDDCCR